MSKETENSYKKFGKDLMNVKKNWKKITDAKKQNKKAIEDALKNI